MYVFSECNLHMYSGTKRHSKGGCEYSTRKERFVVETEGNIQQPQNLSRNIFQMTCNVLKMR